MQQTSPERQSSASRSGALPAWSGRIEEMARAFTRHEWTLQRFGLSPQKLLARALNRNEPKILCVTLPKAGTHLLERALCLHPRLYRKIIGTIYPSTIRALGGLEPLLAKLKPGQMLFAHLPFDAEYPRLLKTHGVQTIFMIRDPRDIVVSAAFFLAATRTHELHQFFAKQPGLKERIEIVIRGNVTPPLEPLNQHLSEFAGWLDHSDLVVRFEDLIGANGGADPAAQQATLSSIYRTIGMPCDETFIASSCGSLFSGSSPTFRKGAIGQWKKHFTPELEALFSNEVGEHLARYGYTL